VPLGYHAFLAGIAQRDFAAIAEPGLQLARPDVREAISQDVTL